MKSLRSVAWVFWVALGSAWAWAGPVSASKPAKLTIVAITDFHGALLPSVLKTKGGEAVEWGGGALLSSYIKRLRAQAQGPVILVDAGDMFQGTMESNTSEGVPVVRLYNYLGVHAAALGNHEFDFGPVGKNPVPLAQGDDPQGALKARIREAKFPVLATNVRNESGQTPSWLKRSTVVTEQGVRVGIIGAATPETPDTTTRANLKGLKFQALLTPIKEEAERLRRDEKVDAVVLTMHDGGACKDNSNQDDLASCDNGVVFELVRKLPEGLIDVVAAGHTHQGVAKRIGRTVILQSYSQGRQLGWAEVDLKGGEKPTVAGYVSVCGAVVEGKYGKSCLPGAVTESMGPVMPAEFLGQAMSPDKKAAKVFAAEVKEVAQKKQERLGDRSVAEGTIARSYRGESALGNLVTDVLRENVPGAEIAVTNGGGLRADLANGPITYGSVFEVLPFDNRLAILRVTGAQLKKLVELSFKNSGGGLSWSGLTFKATGCTLDSVEVGGSRVDETKTYVVAASDYLAQGGGGFGSVKLAPEQVQVVWDGDSILRDVMAEGIRRWNRGLRSSDFMSPTTLRQQVTGTCATEEKK